LQLSTVDYGGCIILYLLPVGCGKAEIRCCGRGGTPPGFGTIFKLDVCGCMRISIFGQRQPLEKVNTNRNSAAKVY
jgi:hypothetical protein